MLPVRTGLDWRGEYVDSRVLKSYQCFQIFEFLKNAVLKSLRDEERQQLSLWVRECYTVGVKTEDLVLEAVEHR